jgi:hypothetical protein
MNQYQLVYVTLIYIHDVPVCIYVIPLYHRAPYGNKTEYHSAKILTSQEI